MDNNKEELKKTHTVEINIKSLALSKGIDTAYKLQIAAGIAPSVAQNLFNERFTEISLKVMEKVCNALQCQPDELFKVTLDKNFFDKVATEAKAKAKLKKENQAAVIEAGNEKVTPIEGLIADIENAPETDLENEAVATEIEPEDEEFETVELPAEPEELELTLEEQAQKALSYEDNEETA